MDKKTAEKVIDVINSTNGAIDELTFLSNQMSEEEGIEFRKILSRAMIALGHDLVMFVVRQYPDLDPDKEHLQKWRKEYNIQNPMKQN